LARSAGERIEGWRKAGCTIEHFPGWSLGYAGCIEALEQLAGLVSASAKTLITVSFDFLGLPSRHLEGDPFRPRWRHSSDSVGPS